MLLGLSGYAGVGKDAIAQVLVRDYGFKRYAFADKVKELAFEVNDSLAKVVELNGWDFAKKFPANRQFLQDLGLGARQVLGDHVWISALDNSIESHRVWHSAAEMNKGNIVITDVRFANELEWIRRQGTNALIVRVEREGFGPLNDHESENTIKVSDCDFVIENNATPEDAAREMMLAVVRFRSDN